MPVVPLIDHIWVHHRDTPKLIHQHPGRAVGLYNRLVWVNIGVGAVAAAVSIILLVEFAWVDEVSDEKTKQMLSALTAALTAFIGSILVTTDETDATFGSLVEKKFIAAFGQGAKRRDPCRAQIRGESE